MRWSTNILDWKLNWLDLKINWFLWKENKKLEWILFKLAFKAQVIPFNPLAIESLAILSLMLVLIISSVI
jgi:hypothetical protein